MKKSAIYVSGVACANLMMLGCLFKIQHWPGSGVLLTLSVFLFCTLFLPVALISSYQSQEEKTYKWLYIVTFVVFAIGMTGTLFKVQHWPGAAVLLQIGIPLPFVLFLPVYLYQTRNDKKNGNTNFLGVMFGLTFLAVFSVLLALNVSKNIIDKVNVSIYNNDNCTLFNQSTAGKMNVDNNIKKKSDELCAYIDELKCELLTATQNNVCDNNRPQSNYFSLQIMNRENTDIPKAVFYENGVNSKMGVLKNKINSYKEALLVSGKMAPELTGLVNELFDISRKASDNDTHTSMNSWEQRVFPSYQLIFVINALSQIQSNVRFVESELQALKN